MSGDELVSDRERADQALTLIQKLEAEAFELTLQGTSDDVSLAPEDWLTTAKLAGQLQRRARLLARLGRGG